MDISGEWLQMCLANILIIQHSYFSNVFLPWCVQHSCHQTVWQTCKNCISEIWKINRRCKSPVVKSFLTQDPGCMLVLSYLKRMFSSDSQLKASEAAKPGEVPCVVCTRIKLKALKSCLVCLASTVRLTWSDIRLCKKAHAHWAWGGCVQSMMNSWSCSAR